LARSRSTGHVRAYAVDDENWTGMQAHDEHWDWFRLRHTVDDVAGSREFVAADFGEVAAERGETDLGGVRAVVVVLALLPAGVLAVGARFPSPADATEYLPLPLAAVRFGGRHYRAPRSYWTPSGCGSVSCSTTPSSGSGSSGRPSCPTGSPPGWW
jgi:hypothetical protein